MNAAMTHVSYDTRARVSSKDLRDFNFIDARVAKDLGTRGVLDNLSAHEAAPHATWLAHAKRARWYLHFTPTSSSWLNLVESRFVQITNRRPKEGTFFSVAQFKDATRHWTKSLNEDPQPFIWKKPAGEMITEVKRGREILA